MLAALTLTFDPVLRFGDGASVRWETVGLALVLFAALLLAARIGVSTPAPDVAATATGITVPRLRVDDFVFIVVGAVPGAIVGGRVGYVLDHFDYYKVNAGAIVDPTQGGFTLTLAVPLGILTGVVIARLLGASPGRWMHVTAPVLLFALAAGKLVGVLGGSGQGALSGLSWATAYAGPGPWASLAADLPSHPSQVYEAVLVSLCIVILYVLGRTRRFRRRDGAALFAALSLWAVARFLVAFTWRDPIVAGPLRMEQLLLAGVAIVGLIGLARRPRGAPVLQGYPPARGIPPAPATRPAPGPAYDADAPAPIDGDPEPA